MKAAVYTLGCKVNQYESQQILTAFGNNGIEITDSKNNADIIVINSCTVTAESNRKTRQAVRRFRSENPDSVIVLTGCFPQAFPEEAQSLTEADIILGNKTNPELIDCINTFIADRKRIINICRHERDDCYRSGAIDTFEGHTRAFVKIQDGCNRYCTYCIIPKARGFSRSRPLEDIRAEIRMLAELGYKEIVFVGINLSSYGLDNGSSLCDALMTAQETEGIERIRLGSLEPDHITDDIIERLAKMSKFCPQFHLSLQSGSNAVLRRMNRHYTAEEYYALCIKLKNAFPDLSLTTDIIIGFPGETDEHFNETIEFAKKCAFMKVHVFPFSPREGTPAYSYQNKIQNAVKSMRCHRLQQICDSVRDEFMSAYIGKTVNVLFETPKNGILQGYTENYTPVSVASNEALCGEIMKVKITEYCDGVCKGILL